LAAAPSLKNSNAVLTFFFSRLCQVHGVIYVVDAADRERFEESKETLALTLESEGISGKPILIFANKQDIDGSATAQDVSEALGMLQRKECRHQVAACTAKPAEGQPVDARISKALKWLLDSIDSDYEKLNSRVVAEKAERDRKENERRAAQRKRAEESKALRLKELAEAERLKREAEENGEAGAGVSGGAGAHASSEQAKTSSNEAWSKESAESGASARAPAEIGSSTPRDGVENLNANSTPLRNTATLDAGAHETPGKDEAPPPSTPVPKPNKLPALEVEGSLAGGGSPMPSVNGKPKLGALKPMPPPINQPETTLPNAMPSPVMESKAGGGTGGAEGSL
jgi:ADP-ribosylation factor-like protein 13B